MQPKGSVASLTYHHGVLCLCCSFACAFKQRRRRQSCTLPTAARQLRCRACGCGLDRTALTWASRSRWRRHLAGERGMCADGTRLSPCLPASYVAVPSSSACPGLSVARSAADGPLYAHPFVCSGASATLLRYWIEDGLLRQEGLTLSAAGNDQPAVFTPPPDQAGSGSPLPSPVAADRPSPVADVPLQTPTHRQAAPSTAGAVPSPRSRVTPTPVADLPVESPLASLATAALPSFSPDKPSYTQAPAAASAADVESAALPVVAAAAGSPCVTVADQCVSTGSPQAGVRSSSPQLRAHPAAVQWAASLRPPGEQLLPGLPDWDRGLSSSPDACMSSSRPRSPIRRACSRPGSPGRHASSRAFSPARQPPFAGEAGQRQQQHPQRNGATEPPLRQQVASPQRSPALPLQQHQAEEGEKAAAALSGPGPLTGMVLKAVSKLQQLHDLEEELQLPGGASFGQGLPRRAGPDRGAPHEPSLRRSLEPGLGAVREASSDGEQGSSRSDGGSRRGESSPRRSAELGRLRRLQDQLEVNMQQVQRLG